MGLFDGKVAIVTGRGARHRPHPCAAARERGRRGRRQRPRRERRAARAPTPHRPSRSSTRSWRRAAGPIANDDSVSSWAGAERMVQQAVDTFGGLDVLINNAGILRDKMSFNMDEAEWDSVIDVHLKGHFAPVAVRGQLLAGEVEGDRRAGEREDRQHRVGVGSLRQRGPGELRGRQGRHRVDDDRDGARARAHRRPRQRDRAGRAHPAHRAGRRRTS